MQKGTLRTLPFRMFTITEIPPSTVSDDQHTTALSLGYGGSRGATSNSSLFPHGNSEPTMLPQPQSHDEPHSDNEEPTPVDVSTQFPKLSTLWRLLVWEPTPSQTTKRST